MAFGGVMIQGQVRMGRGVGCLIMRRHYPKNPVSHLPITCFPQTNWCCEALRRRVVRFGPYYSSLNWSHLPNYDYFQNPDLVHPNHRPRAHAATLQSIIIFKNK